jgi:hypothetical protein
VAEGKFVAYYRVSTAKQAPLALASKRRRPPPCNTKRRVLDALW